MKQHNKLIGIFALISGAAMGVIWIIFAIAGIIQYLLTPGSITFIMLVVAEAITAISLIIGGIMVLKQAVCGEKIAFIALGMMLYGCLYATGKFFHEEYIFLGLFFGLISIVTLIILLLQIVKK
jgi:hypothetical protein